MNDQKYIVNTIFQSIRSMHGEGNADVEKSDDQKAIDPETNKKSLAVALCKSCLSNKEELYNSFDEILNVDSGINFEREKERFQRLNEITKKKKKLQISTKEDFDQKEKYAKKVRSYYFSVDEEYKHLNSDSEFRNVEQLGPRIKKKQDKSERVNQLIIHDLIYFIDELNRSAKQGSSKQ